jgi:hypothetical protein
MSVTIVCTRVAMITLSKKKSSPAKHHGGAWAERSIAPIHSLPRH